MIQGMVHFVIFTSAGIEAMRLMQIIKKKDNEHV